MQPASRSGRSGPRPPPDRTARIRIVDKLAQRRKVVARPATPPPIGGSPARLTVARSIPSTRPGRGKRCAVAPARRFPVKLDAAEFEMRHDLLRHRPVAVVIARRRLARPEPVRLLERHLDVEEKVYPRDRAMILLAHESSLAMERIKNKLVRAGQFNKCRPTVRPLPAGCDDRPSCEPARRPAGERRSPLRRARFPDLTRRCSAGPGAPRPPPALPILPILPIPPRPRIVRHSLAAGREEAGRARAG